MVSSSSTRSTLAIASKLITKRGFEQGNLGQPPFDRPSLAQPIVPVARAPPKVHHSDKPNAVVLFQKNYCVRKITAEMAACWRVKFPESLWVGTDFGK